MKETTPHPHSYLHITLIYLLVASGWILTSDLLLHFITDNDDKISSVSILKGMAFVLVTSFMLHLLLRRAFSQQFQLEDDLRHQMERLQKSQAELAQSEARFRTAVEEAPQPIIIFAEDGEVLTISRVWLKITGYSAEQLRTVDAWSELAYGGQKQPIKEGIDRLFELDGRVDEGDFIIRTADGSESIWHFSSTPLGRLPDGRRVVMSMASDVTQQRKSEAFALENERLKARFQKEQERITLMQRIVSMLSHDLRTPLTVILSSRYFLVQHFDKITPEKRREKLDSIERQVEFATELLEDTVNMIRGNLGEAPFNPAPVNLAALCQVSVEEVNAADQSQHILHFVNQFGIEPVLIDDILVSRILLNLLTNALKYSPEGTEVRLELQRQEDWVVLRVVDHGMGIHEEDVDSIFEPFYRSEDVASIRGTGLGLSIVKDCVERHNGQIEVQSSFGVGSTFIVRLPLQLAPQQTLLKS
ncbi:MAG: PAS domain S-box protein [Anaerolineae bacterium]|nr:PAS domain S-box protein [Anaerolineae bacterium]